MSDHIRIDISGCSGLRCCQQLAQLVHSWGSCPRHCRLGAAVVIGGTLIQVWADSSLRQEGDWFAAIRAGNVLEILGQDGYVWSIALRLVGAVLVIAGLAMKTRVAPSVAQPRESSETF